MGSADVFLVWAELKTYFHDSWCQIGLTLFTKQVRHHNLVDRYEISIFSNVNGSHGNHRHDIIRLWRSLVCLTYVKTFISIDIWRYRFCFETWHRNGSCSCLSFRPSLFSLLMLLLTRKLQNQGFLVVKLKSFHHSWLINEFITAFDYSFGIIKPFFLD